MSPVERPPVPVIVVKCLTRQMYNVCVRHEICLELPVEETRGGFGDITQIGYQAVARILHQSGITTAAVHTKGEWKLTKIYRRNTENCGLLAAGIMQHEKHIPREGAGDLQRAM